MEKNSQKENYFSWKDLLESIYFLLANERRKYIFLTSLLFVIYFYALVPPIILARIIDFFIAYKPGTSLVPFFIYVFIIGALHIIISYFRLSLKKALGDMQTEIIYKARVKGFEKLLDFSIAWHDQENTGNKFQRLQNGLMSFRTFMNMLNNEIVQATTAAVGAIAVFIFLRPYYTFFFIGYVIIFLFIASYFYNRIRRVNDEYNEILEKASGSYVEGLSNVLTIKTLGAKESFKSLIAKREGFAKEQELKKRRLGINMWRAFNTFNGVCYIVFLLLVGREIFLSLLSVGSVFIFYGYLDRLIQSGAGMLDVYENFIQSKSGIGRMMPILKSQPNVKSGNLMFPLNWDKISLHDAHFNYGSEGVSTISSINVEMTRNQKIGVVGKTGSGKSTFAKLLVGLYDLDSGEYKIGGTNFYSIRHEEMIDKISLVLQDSEMFNLSLVDNITLMKNIPLDLFQKAIKLSQLEEVVEKLPDGLATLIGEKGYHLSGGERQRVGIARAICRDPEIFIFDEATSSLDSKTEQLIQQGIEKELKEKTIITIAHRVSTLKDVDVIYVFDEGKIVEYGQFSDLAADPHSCFYQVYTTQTPTENK